MWSFAWEPVVSAAITAVFALVGVVLATRSQSDKTRRAGLAQHNEQNDKLDQLIKAQTVLDHKVDRNNAVAVNGLADVKGQVSGLMETNNVLFGMIVDLDKKVTKVPNSRKRAILEDAES